MIWNDMKCSNEHSDIVTIVESFLWAATWIHSSSHIIHPRNSAMSHGDVCWEASPPGRFHLSAKMVGHLWTPSASNYHDVRFPICPGGARWLSIMKQLYALVLLSLGKNHGNNNNNTRGLKRIWKDNRLKKTNWGSHTGVVWYFLMLQPSKYQKVVFRTKAGFWCAIMSVFLLRSLSLRKCGLWILVAVRHAIVEHVFAHSIHTPIYRHVWYILCICRIYILGCRLPGILYAWGNQFSHQHWCCA